MTESKHADVLRELGYKDFGVNACEARLMSAEHVLKVQLEGNVAHRPCPPPFFFLISFELDGLTYKLSFAVDEYFHQWVFFSEVRDIRPEELTDVGFKDATAYFERLSKK